MKKKKKSSRKMPPHIVLPDGMWRFVKKGSRKVSRTVKTLTRKRKRKGASSMVRRKKYARRASRSRGGNLMGGIVHPRGIIANAILGAGAATLTENLLGQPLGNLTGVAAGFAVGGIGGAAGAYGRNMLKGALNIGVGGNNSAFVA